MTDDALRATERALVSAPADLELRRRHVRQLQRASAPAERTLAALDLAWRLGADELWDELREALGERTLELGSLELRYVPAGPFVMGRDDGDADEGPARLVELSAFHTGVYPLYPDSVAGSRRWADGSPSSPIHAGAHAHAREAVEAFAAAARAAGLPGRAALMSEAQWERVARAGLLRPDRWNPYGVILPWDRGLDWTADTFHPDAYARAAVRDPVETRPSELSVVRGVDLPEPRRSCYREAARASDGRFVIERPERAGLLGRALGLDARKVSTDKPLHVRVVLVADPPA